MAYPKIFNVASLFVSADLLPNCYRVRQKSLPKKMTNTSEQASRAFADALSEYYRTEQGRGHRCTMETYLRGGRRHYFFAYPDDYPDTYIGHDDTGVFIKRPQKQSFEEVFVYEPQTGALDMYAQGDRDVRARLLYIFYRSILDESPPPELPEHHPYELNALLTGDCRFVTDPADGIEEVRIRKLRLAIGRRRIIQEADLQGGSQDIFDMMTECLSTDCLNNPIRSVTHAESQFAW